MSTVRTLHFSIDLEWLTGFIRQAWSEGRYQYAYDLLKSSGCPAEYHDEIIRGNVRMVGVNEGTTESDRWRPDLSMCHRGTYPDPDEIAGIAEEGERYKYLYLELQRIEYFELCRMWEKAQTGGDLHDLAFRLRQIPWEFVETLEPLERTPWNLAQQYNMVEAKATAFGGWQEIPSVEQYVAHQLELDERPAPDPDPTHTSPYGWLLPDGKLYPCEYWEHDWLVSALGKTVHEAERDGWVRLGYSKAMDLPVIGSHEELTQAQIDSLWDWCEANHCPFPEG